MLDSHGNVLILNRVDMKNLKNVTPLRCSSTYNFRHLLIVLFSCNFTDKVRYQLRKMEHNDSGDCHIRYSAPFILHFLFVFLHSTSMCIHSHRLHILCKDLGHLDALNTQKPMHMHSNALNATNICKGLRCCRRCAQCRLCGAHFRRVRFNCFVRRVLFATYAHGS